MTFKEEYSSNVMKRLKNVGCHLLRNVSEATQRIRKIVRQIKLSKSMVNAALSSGVGFLSTKRSSEAMIVGCEWLHTNQTVYIAFWKGNISLVA
jgi:hypothetical protein